MLLLVSRNIGKPCPTRDEIMASCGVCKKRVDEFLENLVDRGLIEIECRGQDGLGRSQQRRMRVQLGEWTAWTHRPGYLGLEGQKSARASGGPRMARSRHRRLTREGG